MDCIVSSIESSLSSAASELHAARSLSSSSVVDEELVLWVTSLSRGQFYRLCADNPDGIVSRGG